MGFVYNLGHKEIYLVSCLQHGRAPLAGPESDMADGWLEAAFGERVFTRRGAEHAEWYFSPAFQIDGNDGIGITPASFPALLGNDPDAQGPRKGAQGPSGMLRCRTSGRWP